MKSIRFLAAIFLILAMAGPSCQKFNLNTDDLDIKLDLNVIKTNIMVQFIDAATGEPVGFNDGKKVEVSIFGPDSQWVVDNSGKRMQKMYSAAGYLTCGLDPYNAKPTPNDPVSLILVADVDGYVSTSMPITLRSEGSHDFVVNMVDLAFPPDGVVVTARDNSGSTVGGKLVKDMDMSTDNSDVNMKIPAGTEIRDAQGNLLDGKLKTTIVHFNPVRDSALRCFPGGLNVDVNKEGGERENGAFFSAGFVAIDIKDESGRKAAKFGGGKLDLNLAIDDKVKNPETGQSVKAGDKVPLWSYDERNGKWTFEKTTEIHQTPAGLRAEAQLEHLSYWNLDWFETSCDFIEIFFTTADASKSGETGWGYGLYFTATLTGSDEFRTDGYFSGYPELTGTQTILNTEALQSVPRNRQITLTFHAQEGTTPLWNIPEPITYDFCSSTPVEVPLTPNNSATGGGGDQTLTITFNIDIYCTDVGASASIPDGILLRYRLKGSSSWGTCTASGGTFTVAGLQQNKIYEVQALYNQEWVPTPGFEYFVEPSSVTVLTKNIRFEIDCGV